MFKKKRGQLYIVTAIILCSALFGIIAIKQKNQIDFNSKYNDLFENYKQEASNTINYAVYNNQNLFTKFNDFNLNFKEYAREINLNYEILYLVANESMIIINNDFNSIAYVNVSSLNYNISKNNSINFTYFPNLTINIYNYEYSFNISKNEYNAIMRFEDKDNIYIFKR